MTCWLTGVLCVLDVLGVLACLTCLRALRAPMLTCLECLACSDYLIKYFLDAFDQGGLVNCGLC